MARFAVVTDTRRHMLFAEASTRGEVRLTVEGHTYVLAFADDRPDMPSDPLVQLFIDDEEEARFVSHPRFVKKG